MYLYHENKGGADIQKALKKIGHPPSFVVSNICLFCIDSLYLSAT